MLLIEIHRAARSASIFRMPFSTVSVGARNLPMARISRTVVSTTVLIVMSSRELAPLAILTDFLKIEMCVVPLLGKCSARYVAEVNYHIMAETGLVTVLFQKW